MPQTIATNAFARNLGSIQAGHHLHLFVIDATNAIFVARTKQELESPGIVQGGLKILNSNGPVEISWEGETWVLGGAASVAYSYSFE